MTHKTHKKVNQFHFINRKFKRITSVNEPAEKNSEIVNDIQEIDGRHSHKKPCAVLNILLRRYISTNPLAFSYLYQEVN